MSVLIGLVDQKIESSETKNWDINRIGGFPSWLIVGVSPEAPACRLCGHPSSLVTQLYCPLGGSAYHRCIYIFACLSNCSRSQEGWRAVRSLRLDEQYKEATFDDKYLTGQSESWLDGQDDWGEGSDSWGGGDSDWGDEEFDESENENCPNSRKDEACCTQPRKPEMEGVTSVSADLSSREMNTAFSQLRIATEPPQVPVDDSGLTSATVKDTDSNKCQTEPVRPCGGDAPGITEESIMLVSDEERLNAVTHLLNTKTTQDLESNAQSSLQSSKAVPPSHLQPYYLCVVEEPHGVQDVGSDHITELIRSYEKVEGVTLDNLVSDGGKLCAKGGSSKESYEKTELKHGDKVFHKFLKRLQRCPKQCVRYERGGTPMLVKKLGVSSPDEILPCPYCGAKRVFELQLLPPLICSLKLENGSSSPLEFGTVLIFTCEANCWAVGDNPCDLSLREEFIIVQGDPDEHLYR